MELFKWIDDINKVEIESDRRAMQRLKKTDPKKYREIVRFNRRLGKLL